MERYQTATRGYTKQVTYGRVKSLERIVSNGKVNRLIKERILKTGKNRYGYLIVVLCKNGKLKTHTVHRLVAEAFIPNPQGKAQVNHKDTIKTNNIVDVNDLYGEATNLEWATNSENQQHAYDNGLKENTRKCWSKIGKMYGGHNSKRVKQYDLQGTFIKEWDCIAEVERQLNIANQSISACCKGKLKKAGGYKWEYV